jgi:hypothetical protein
MKVKELEDQLEIHRRKDKAVPIKSHLKNKAAKLDALLQAVERHERLVADAALLDEEEPLGSEGFEAQNEALGEDDGEDML